MSVTIVWSGNLWSSTNYAEKSMFSLLLLILAWVESRFFDNRYGYSDEFEYKRSGKDQGLVVIFNQNQFDSSDLQKRLGTNRDVNEIVHCLGRLGYNIDGDLIFNDLTREEVLDKLKERKTTF